MADSSFNYTIEAWNTTGERVEYTTNIFKVLKRDMVIPSENHKATFSVLDAPDWINVIALTPENNIVLVEQYRYGIEKPTLELPGGVCDDGEDPKVTCIRELAEETGFSSDEWLYLGNVSSNPAMQTNYTHTYVARNCIKTVDQQLDGNERINVHVLTLDEFLGLIRGGEIKHSLMVAAIGKFLLSEFYDAN